MSKQNVVPARKSSKASVVLDAPRTLAQEPLYNMKTTVRAQFSDLFITDNKGDRIATVVNTDKKKETKIGAANVDFLCGMVIGAMGGRGDAPGGAAIWVANEAGKMSNLNKYTLVAVPKARGGTLEAPVPVWLEAVSGKAQLLNLSITKHPIPRRVRETSVGAEEEQIDLWL